MNPLIAARRVVQFHRSSPSAAAAVWLCSVVVTTLLQPPFEASDAAFSLFYLLILGLAISVKVTHRLSVPEVAGAAGAPTHADLRSSTFYYRQLALIGVDMLVVLRRLAMVALLWAGAAAAFFAYTQSERAEEIAQSILDADLNELVRSLPRLTVLFSMAYVVLQMVSLAIFKQPTFALAGSQTTSQPKVSS